MKPSNEFRTFVRECLEPRVLPVYRSHPRRWHGPLHISRCLIFSEAMLGCYKSVLNQPANRFDAVAIRLALGWHDAARQDDGPDQWEADSAKLAAEFVAACGFGAGYGDYVGSLITRRSTDPNAELVRACDTLDILRLCPLWAFDANRFGFLHPTEDPFAKDNETAARLRKQLIPEAKQWITETEARGAELAASVTCCQDLLQDLAGKRSQYPILTTWLDGALTG